MSEFPRDDASALARGFHRLGVWATSKSLAEIRHETAEQTQRRGALTGAVMGVLAVPAILYGGPHIANAVDHAYDVMRQNMELPTPLEQGSPNDPSNELRPGVDNHAAEITVRQPDELPSDQTVSVRVH